jgi:hypothetical protein
MQSTPRHIFSSHSAGNLVALSGRVSIIVVLPLVLLIGILIINLILLIG